MGSIRVSVRGEIAAARGLADLEDKIRTRIVVRALDRGGLAMRTEASKGLRTILNLKREPIERTLSVRKASVSFPSVVLGVSHRPVPLRDFDARKAGQGVSVKVLKAGSRKIAKSAFLATVGKGRHVGVFRRQGPKRLPLSRELMGPEPFQVVNQDQNLSDHIRDRGLEVFSDRFAHELDRELSRA